MEPPIRSAVGTTASSSTRPSVRPKSAAVGVRKPLRLGIGVAATTDDRAEDALSTSTRHRLTHSKPRPPSASSALSLAVRRPRPQSSASHATNQSVPKVDAPGISSQVLREEIETQCRVTRRAQRELNALRVQHDAKLHEMALLQRHLQAFDVDALPGPHCATTATTATTVGRSPPRILTPLEQLKDETRRLDTYKKTLRAMLDRLARHMHFLRANSELLESQRVAAVREAALCHAKVAQDKSLCAELEAKRFEVERIRAAHALDAQQQLASLRSELESRTRVSQQRHDADRRREEMLRLVESRPPEATTHADGATAAAVFQPPPLQKRQSQGRRDSFRMLLHESLTFFGASRPSSRRGSVDDGTSPTAIASSTAAMGVALSSRRLQTLRVHTSTAAVETLSAAMNRETFYQVYETQYERILETTRESDLAIVLERYRGYRETRARLEQIERDLVAEDAALDATRTARTQQLQQLRFSGIAEVEKRKKIRDFLEQQHLVKSAARAQAKEAFVHQLKAFSYVQQGILNITELLKCLDDKFSPPGLANATSALVAAVTTTVTATPSATAVGGSMVHRSVLTPAAAAEIEWLQSLVYSCRSVVRATAALSPCTDFSEAQIARLGEIDPTLGLAAGAWAVERLKHSIPGGNVVWKRGPDGPSIEDANDADDDEDTEAGSDDDDENGTDSDDDIEDRDRIKHNEAETLAQAELLIRTLDSRQQIAQQEQSMQRVRRAFLGDVNEDSSEPAPPTPLPPALDAAAKLAAVHAFFREKRLREKHEHHERRQAIAALGGFAQLSNGPKKRGSVVGAPHVTNSAAAGAVAMASIMAEVRAGAAIARRVSVSVLKNPANNALTTVLPNTKPPPPQRKRSNAVSFAVSLPPASTHQSHHPQQQSKPASVDDASRRLVLKPPTRPATAATGASAPLHRRGSNSQWSGAALQQQLVRHRPDNAPFTPRY